MNDIIKAIENEQLKSDITDFNVGDTVKVYAKVIEGSRERILVYLDTRELFLRDRTVELARHLQLENFQTV